MLITHPLAQVTDEVLECIVLGTMADGGGGAKKAQNVFYYRKTLNNAATSKAQFVTAFTTTVITPLLAAASSRYNPNYGKVRNIQNVADLASTIAIAGVGAIATDSQPTDDAVVVLLKSLTRGRQCMGRKHFAGSNEADTTKDLLNAGGVTAWGAVRDALKTVLIDAGGNGWTPFVLGRSASQLKAPVKIYGANVSDAILLKTIGTMRKRRTPTVYA
jgi:hypothetical protein